MSEGTTFTSPSGTAIHLRLNRAKDGWDSSDLAEHMEAAARNEVSGISEMTESTTPLDGGRVAHQRRFTFVQNGTTSVGRVICLVDDGLALTASASWPADGVGGDAEIESALSSVRLVNRPVTNVSEQDNAATPRAPARRPPVDDSAWSDLRTAWSEARPAEAELRRETRWSPAELAVIASILGAPSFPTVGYEVLAALPEPALSATLDAVTRSFLARGLVRPGEGGIAVLADELHEAMEVTVYPDLTILVERFGAPANGRWWFGLRLDSAEQVTVLSDGSRDVAEIRPDQVMAQILALAGALVQAPAEPSTGPDPDRITLAELTSGTSRVASLARINTAWRVGETVRGGTFTWAIGADGAMWLADMETTATSPTWLLRPLDFEGLRAELLAHLPGE